jgi:NADH-quinone oxidoreductase subunit M
MILVWMLIILLVGGTTAWAVGQIRPLWARWVALLSLFLDLALGIYLWLRLPGRVLQAEPGTWLVQVKKPWIPQFGISLHLALDGLSLLLMVLTFFLGIMAVVASWSEIKERVGFFYFNLLWVLAGVLGVFLALDLLLFYVFWELMLVPMLLLIVIWGHENRTYAAIKFFLFTQASSLLMLVAIVTLFFVHHGQTGVYTFDYTQLLGTPLAASTARWLMLGFFVAFAVKLPAIPLHTWLPDAHTEAPTAGSVILAGLLLKTGAYGLLRFAVPLFPEAAQAFAPLAMLLGMIGILYGAVLAFAQSDLKRLVAYTSISHLGFVLLGIFAGNRLALQGAVMQMICHGLSTGGLFMVAGALQERLHTRDMRQMGGLWATMPRMGGVGLILAMASLGLPGLGNFVAEFLTLVGAFRVNPVITIIATVGLVLATIYALQLVQQVFHGARTEHWQRADFSLREMVVMGVMIASLVWLGLFPRPVLDTVEPVLSRFQLVVTQPESSGRSSNDTR